jgi:hypothetical protein
MEKPRRSLRRTLRRYWLVLAVVVALLAIVVFQIVATYLSLETDRPTYSTTNYSRIEDGLFLGGFLGEPPPGACAVLNLCEVEDPYQAEIHRWEPIRDGGPAPSIVWLRHQVDFVDEQRRAGRPVFIHCAAGASRSAMVLAAYLMAREGWSRDQALSYIRERRRSIGPNPAFMRLLLEWEKQVRKPGPATQPSGPQTQRLGS